MPECHCLLLSQGCSALSWLDLGSQDNSPSGQHLGHHVAQSTAMWLLHLDFTMSQADFHVETGNVLLLHTQGANCFPRPVLAVTPPVWVGINHKALCGGFSEFPFDSLSIPSLLVLSAASPELEKERAGLPCCRQSPASLTQIEMKVQWLLCLVVWHFFSARLALYI